MNIEERLLEKRIAIKEILAKYGASTVHIFGDPENVGGMTPDVDVLIDFDQITPVLVCFRNHFLRSGRADDCGDRSGGMLVIALAKLLRCRVNVCQEGAVKRFHPETYRKTLATHKWDPDTLDVLQRTRLETIDGEL